VDFVGETLSICSGGVSLAGLQNPTFELTAGRATEIVGNYASMRVAT
jgi:hypothetical protein